MIYWRNLVYNPVSVEAVVRQRSNGGRVCIYMRRWCKRRRSMHSHISEYSHIFLKHLVKVITVLSKLNECIEETWCITTRTVVYVAAVAQRWCKQRRSMHSHVSEYSHNFFEASCEGYYSIIKIKWCIEETWCITTRTVVYVAAVAQRRCKQRRSMYSHVSEYSHNFFEASCEGYYSIIKIKWCIEETWCITTRTVVYMAAVARRRCKWRWSMHSHVSEYSHNFFEASCEGNYSIIKVKLFIQEPWYITSFCGSILSP